MKAILILDEMPKNCAECILANEDYDVCQATQKSISYNERGYGFECPLKPIPEKKDTYKTPEERKQRHEIRTAADLKPFLIYYARRGFNACIDEIIGEENV